MQLKQLYATLEFADNEVRLLVVEHYMSRFNVLKVDRVKTDCIKHKRIVKPQVLSSIVTKIVKNAEQALGLKINSLVLCIPSEDVKSLRKRINVTIEDDKKIEMSHIRMGLSKAIHTVYDSSFEFVNLGSITYTLGGISSRTVPIGEKCEHLIMDIELIYANKEIVHSYVQCVEDAGVGVFDICLDSFALAEESAMLEKSMDKAMVLIDLQKEQTVLSLFFKGRMLECGIVPIGYGTWIQDLHQTYNLNVDECEKLLKDTCFDEKGIYDDMISYIWLDKEQQKEVNKKSLYACVEKNVHEWVAQVNEICDPIIAQSNSKCILTGDGADIVGIHSVLTYVNMENELYIPTTIGAREGKLAACLGASYCVKRIMSFNEKIEPGVIDLGETPNIPLSKQRKPKVKDGESKEVEELGFTKKLRNILQSI